MKILMIGNGFDLAHGLPTTYADFLCFCRLVEPIYESWMSALEYEEKILKEWKKNSEITEFLKNIYSQTERKREMGDDKKYYTEIITNCEMLDDFYSNIQGNLWIQYFQQQFSRMGENWIDFEMEISKIIQEMEILKGYTKGMGLPQDGLNEIAYLIQSVAGKSIKDVCYPYCCFGYFRRDLETDLNRLILALEIYLSEFVNKIDIENRNPDINELEVTHILSFNYTDTYARMYDILNTKKYDYIHGKANSNHTLETNNMVLGIDEYLPEDRRNKETEFIAFKKYYQRIYKETGCKYKEWVEFIRDNKRIDHRLYIFGHSLDETDGDILSDLILNDNVYTTIYYWNKETMGKQIANLVKVIGQNELIQRTGGRKKTIVFKKQQ